MLIDVIMITLGLLVAHAFSHESHVTRTLLICFLEGLIFVEIMLFGKAYRVEYYTSPVIQFKQVTVAAPVAALILGGIEFGFLGSLRPEGLTLVVLALASYVAVMIGRLAIVIPGMRILQRRKVLQQHAIIVGDLALSRELLTRLGDHHPLVKFVGIFSDQDPGETKAIMGVPVCGKMEDIVSFAQQHQINLAIITHPWESPRQIGATLDLLGRVAVDVMMPMLRPEFQPRFAQVREIDGVPMLQFAFYPLKGSRILIKRIEDYVVGAIGVILAAPILLLSCIAIRLESPGPVWFRQERIGYNNKPFTIYKLRTMHLNPADDGSRGARRDDPRVTRVGRILRKLSLDELPQLFNVLEGTMSIVGPRPHVARMQIGEGREYDTIRTYMHRYRMKPGITGWAQINGMRGSIHSLEKAERVLQLDLYYVEHWSVWLDIKIMFLTLFRGMTGKEAY